MYRCKHANDLTLIKKRKSSSLDFPGGSCVNNHKSLEVEAGRKQINVRMMRCDTQPAITGSEIGRGPGANECRLPLEAGKCKQKYSPLDPPDQNKVLQIP